MPGSRFPRGGEAWENRRGDTERGKRVKKVFLLLAILGIGAIALAVIKNFAGESD